MHKFRLDFYQLTNSTSDFKSRSNDVFDRLSNLEKQHDQQTKIQTPVVIPDEEPTSSTQQNPTIPNHAITFKKRAADDESFARPSDKWKKYDLDDVNEHHIGPMSNQHALHDFLRTRTKPSITKEEDKDDELPSTQIFKRPLPKKPITTDEDDDRQQFTPIRAPISSNKKADNDDDSDDGTRFKLQSSRPKARGVLSTNEKKVPVKPSMEISEDKDDVDDEHEDDDDDDDDVEDELLEP